MAAGIDVIERVPNHALLVDHERGAKNGPLALPVRLLLLENAVLAADLALGIREQPD